MPLVPTRSAPLAAAKVRIWSHSAQDLDCLTKGDGGVTLQLRNEELRKKKGKKKIAKKLGAHKQAYRPRPEPPSVEKWGVVNNNLPAVCVSTQPVALST